MYYAGKAGPLLTSTTGTQTEILEVNLLAIFQFIAMFAIALLPVLMLIISSVLFFRLLKAYPTIVSKSFGTPYQQRSGSVQTRKQRIFLGCIMSLAITMAFLMILVSSYFLVNLSHLIFLLMLITL